MIEMYQTHFREQRRHIDSESHVGDDLLDDVPCARMVARVLQDQLEKSGQNSLLLQLGNFALFLFL